LYILIFDNSYQVSYVTVLFGNLYTIAQVSRKFEQQKLPGRGMKILVLWTLKKFLW